MAEIETLLLAQKLRGQVARQLREGAGLTRADVASHCGVTVAAVRHWESGLRRPQGEPARKYAALVVRLALDAGVTA